MLRIYLCFFVLFFLTGCVSGKQPVQVDTAPDSSVLLLEGAAERIQHSLDQLSQIRQAQAKDQEKVNAYALPNSSELRSKISFKWAGPFDLAAKVLAEKIDYEFVEVGKEKARSILVNADFVDSPVFRILEKIAWQAEGRAELVLDESKRIVQIVYN